MSAVPIGELEFERLHAKVKAGKAMTAEDLVTYAEEMVYQLRNMADGTEQLASQGMLMLFAAMAHQKYWAFLAKYPGVSAAFAANYRSKR